VGEAVTDALETGAAHEIDERLVDTIIRRVIDDLALVVDRELSFEILEVSRIASRKAGLGKVHISFKLGFQSASGLSYGCLLAPLPDAIALASYLMMVPDESVKQRRRQNDLDRSLKDAMIEVANFVGGATDAAMRSMARSGLSARSEGCQGVRADVRPAFEYEEGTPLVFGRIKVKLHTFDPFEMLLMTPVMSELEEDGG